MKIISGGQTGADRAAIDTAICLGLDYGGSIPKGRRAEDGPIDTKYDQMTELESKNYKARTEKNVIDADATLIFTTGTPTGGTERTVKYAAKHGKAYLLIDLNIIGMNEIVEMINNWLLKNHPQILNIAGPRESKSPGIHDRVKNILHEVLRRLMSYRTPS